MPAKLTTKNQLTLPKSITKELGEVQYFDITVKNGQIILTPIKIHRADAVRAKLSTLGLTERDIAEAIDWGASDMNKGPLVVIDTSLGTRILLSAKVKLPKLAII